MGIEIDFLAVGEKGRSGDAICLRFGDLFGSRTEQKVITIDGGNNNSGDALVKHIRDHYKTEVVDLALLTHPDSDHACGMRAVLENLIVRFLGMHRPWLHSATVKSLTDDSRATITSIKRKTKDNLCAAYEVEQLAISKRVEIFEPFAGEQGNPTIRVLGPSREFYRKMLAKYDFMPGAAPITGGLLGAIGEAVKWVAEQWDSELLLEPAIDATSPENNSSLILLLTIEGRHYVFTGDAGVPALSLALDQAALLNIDWSNLAFFQTPHHGSKRNVGPSILNRLFGMPSGIEVPATKNSYISAAKEGEPKHPSKRVTNAFRRRGVNVYATCGSGICLPIGAPTRTGWSSITPLPFYYDVEDD
jgi:beta-lactamase superfamily II metal-dependent hydrolase